MNIKGVSPELLKQYQETPEDFTLVGAMADQAQESGEDDTAEFLRWIQQKRRAPDNRGSLSSTTGRLSYSYPPGSSEAFYVPRIFRILFDKANGIGSWATSDSDGVAEMLRRLHAGWMVATPEEKQQMWEWEPPVQEEAKK